MGADGISTSDGSDHSLVDSVTQSSPEAVDSHLPDIRQTVTMPSGLTSDSIHADSHQSTKNEVSLQECVTKGEEKMP